MTFDEIYRAVKDGHDAAVVAERKQIRIYSEAIKSSKTPQERHAVSKAYGKTFRARKKAKALLDAANLLDKEYCGGTSQQHRETKQ